MAQRTSRRKALSFKQLKAFFFMAICLEQPVLKNIAPL
jgi:hypothetical protein